MPQAAFVLHRRDYQETSLLVDLLTQNDGRVRVIAKGAKRNRNPWRAVLQPFALIQVDYSGRHELKTLRLAEAEQRPLTLSGNYLYSGFYLNELLQRLLPMQADIGELFQGYQYSLELLAQQHAMEETLRWFEWQLLCVLGFAFDWRTEATTGAALDNLSQCFFDPEQGFLHQPHHPKATAWPTQLVTSIAELQLPTQLMSTAQRKLMKLIMRDALAPHLGGQPLRSRELFRR